MRNGYPSQQQAREQMCEIGRRLAAKDMVAANDGNIAVKVGQNRILLTPTGVNKGDMRPEMMTLTDGTGRVVEEGTLSPSSEAKMHLRIFQESPALMASVHAHPIYASACGIIGEWLEAPISAGALIQLGTVPVAPYAAPGTDEVGEGVAPFARDYRCCLLAFHGAVSWGGSLMEAYARMEALEHHARLYLLIRKELGCTRTLTEEQAEALLRRGLA